MRNAVKVLIVDDDKSSTALLAEVVKRLGCKPIVANKPADALNVVRLQTVQAALVDVLLPKMSGVDLAQEFRKTKFGDNPIIFVSGVFKDKNFAQDTLKKTGAVEFLFKPFGAEDLMLSIRKALSGLLNADKWSVQSLLTRRMNHTRERAKAIENLEQVKGSDFPYVLSFILQGQVSGHLNIVNDIGEIFGVTIHKGLIAQVDSAESQATAVLALISNGYLAQEDWDAYQASGNRRQPLERLVEEGFVSPHAVAVARRDQIIGDFRAICGSVTLQLNFVPQDDSGDAPAHGVSVAELLGVFVESLSEFFPKEYLVQFYESVLNSPIQTGQILEAADAIFNVPAFAEIPNVRSAVEKNETLKSILDRYPDKTELVYGCIHLLILNGIIAFTDVYAAKNLSDQMARYKKLWAELKDRAPDEVFEYFGATPSAPKELFNSIFDEFTKSNNPAQLPPDAPDDLKELGKKCYDLVKNAHSIMTDDTKRLEMLEMNKANAADRLKRSNKLTAEGLDLLRKGMFPMAMKKLQEAESLQPTTLQFLISVWAEVKSGAATKLRLQEVAIKLDQLPMDDRKSPYYFMALGLVKKGLGDSTSGVYFEKVLQLDSLFVEARRELNSMSPVPKKEKLDIFNGDITEIVSALFKRKAE